MAKGDRTVAEAAPSKGGMMGWLVVAAFGLISGATGFAVPMVFVNKPLSWQALISPGATHAENQHKRARDPAKHESAAPPGAKREPLGNQPALVSFGEVVVNLAEEKLTRYLRVTLTLQVDSAHEEMVKKAVERKKTILKNWLIGYLSDKELDEVRGAMGLNRLRREIQDQFNRLLFPEGGE